MPRENLGIWEARAHLWSPPPPPSPQLFRKPGSPGAAWFVQLSAEETDEPRSRG